MKHLLFSLLLVPTFMLTSCRAPESETNYNLTKGEKLDGDLITFGEDKEDPTDDIFYGEEVYDQDGVGSVSAVDITWIIDNSGSMEDEQTALQNNFDSFIDNFLVNGKAQYPFKMAVTTTEAYRSGKGFFEGFDCPGASCSMFDLSHTAAENNFNKFKDDFISAVGVGIEGNGREKALYSASYMTDLFAGWYGGNDTLSIYVIVTDEKEQSHFVENRENEPLLDANGEQYTIAKWAQILQSKKDNSAKVRVFPIVRIDTIPEGTNEDVGDHGSRYLELAELTGGVRSDIDQPFDGILDGISTTIVNLLDSFLLKGGRNIAVDTIKVFVDGVESNDWVFDNNAIKFNNAPVSGAKIKITYEFKK